MEVHKADPDAPEVARRLIALIAARWPATPAEHIGSSAVPGLAGKNIIDLLLAAQPVQIWSPRRSVSVRRAGGLRHRCAIALW